MRGGTINVQDTWTLMEPFYIKTAQYIVFYTSIFI